MSAYAIDIVNDYVVPAGTLTKEGYVDFVMNMAAQSYMHQYNTTTPEDGIQAACDAYNAGLTPPADGV